MAQDLPRVSANVVISKPSLQKVFDNLRASGFGLIGPRVRDGAVVLDEYFLTRGPSPGAGRRNRLRLATG